MKTIIILGAGRSASSLIHYLCGHAASNEWQVKVGDYQKELADEKIKGV